MKTRSLAIRTVTLLTTTVLALVGCEQKDEKNDKPQGKVRVSANSNQSSDELTLAAEQLVSPATFMLAYRLAKTAYEKDPKNLKAEFYMRLLERFEAFRGIYTRIRPILNNEQIKNLEKHTSELPKSPLKSFLTEKSGAEIRNIPGLQSVVSQYYKSIVEFRRFLKQNQSAELEIYLNPYAFHDTIQSDMTADCVTIHTRNGQSVVVAGDYSDSYPISEGSYNIEVECNYKDIGVRKLDIGDLIALRQIVSAELLHGTFNNYSLEGLEKLSERESKQPMSNQEKAQFLASQKSFGKLNKDHLFSILKELGSDFSTSLKWALKYQSTLCPKGYETYDQRKGHLFDSGVCTNQEESEVQKFIQIMDRALGGATQIEIEKDDKIVTTNMNVFAWAQNPIQDLRQVMPVSWNDCDEVTSLKDNTLGGIFLDNNASQILAKKVCEGNE